MIQAKKKAGLKPAFLIEGARSRQLDTYSINLIIEKLNISNYEK